MALRLSAPVDIRSRRSILLTLAAVSGCRPLARRGDGLATVFADFIYVGAFPAWDVHLKNAAHAPTIFPAIWEAQTQYIFHLDTDREFDELASRILPQRLRSAGARVLVAPRSWRDMAIPDSGNPIWQIEFRTGSFRGFLRNRHEPTRYKQFFDGGKIRNNIPDPRIDDYIVNFID